MVHTSSAGGGGSELFADGKWYYHADDHSCRPAKEIADEINACRESEAMYLLGIGPDENYQLRPEDETCLGELGKLI